MVSNSEGRFPANIILDETAAELLDLQSGISKSTDGIRKLGDYDNNTGFGKYKESKGHNDKGGASRFFMLRR